MDRIVDTFLSTKLWVRERLWKGLKLRRKLPEAEVSIRELAFYRLVLDRAWPASARAEIDALWDVGCRNWSYAEALADAFPQAALTGVEVDGGRRYPSLYRRLDMARAHAERLRHAQGRDVRTFFQDFLTARPDDGFVRERTGFTFFFPFVSEDPCRAWGLPSRFADFGSLLFHARALKAVSILSTHQGNWEAELAREAYLRAGLSSKLEEHVIHPEEFQDFWPSPHPVHVLKSGETFSIKAE